MPNAFPSAPQIHRLQHILEWLRAGRRVNATVLAEHFKVSKRTAASDLEYIQYIGVPIEYVAGKRSYVLTEPYEQNLPLAAIQGVDLAAFLVARFALDALGGGVHAKVLGRVTERLAEHLPEAVRVSSQTVTDAVRFETGPRPRSEFAALASFQQAVKEQTPVEVTYYTASRDEETDRVIEPYALVNHEKRWYLIGYCRRREAVRDFRIDRIRQFDVLSRETFRMQPDFDLDAFLEPAFGMHRGGREYLVCVRFSAYQARWVSEDIVHDSQTMAWRADGQLEVRMEVAGLEAVARWVLQYGPEAEVLSPPALRHLIAEQAQEMARMYASDLPSGDGAGSV